MSDRYEATRKIAALTLHFDLVPSTRVTISDEYTTYTLCTGKVYRIFNAEELQECIDEQTAIRNENWLQDTSIESPAPGGNLYLRDALESYVAECDPCSAWDAVSQGLMQTGRDFHLDYTEPDETYWTWRVFVLND